MCYPVPLLILEKSGKYLKALFPAFTKKYVFMRQVNNRKNSWSVSMKGLKKEFPRLFLWRCKVLPDFYLWPFHVFVFSFNGLYGANICISFPHGGVLFLWLIGISKASIQAQNLRIYQPFYFNLILTKISNMGFAQSRNGMVVEGNRSLAFTKFCYANFMEAALFWQLFFPNIKCFLSSDKRFFIAWICPLRAVQLVCKSELCLFIIDL